MWDKWSNTEAHLQLPLVLLYDVYWIMTYYCCLMVILPLKRSQKILKICLRFPKSRCHILMSRKYSAVVLELNVNEPKAHQTWWLWRETLRQGLHLPGDGNTLRRGSHDTLKQLFCVCGNILKCNHLKQWERAGLGLLIVLHFLSNALNISVFLKCLLSEGYTTSVETVLPSRGQEVVLEG